MPYLYFLRHGETDYNRRGIVQGSGVDSDLNDTGLRQAQAFFEAYRHLDFEQVYVSELRRTHQTLAPWRDLGHELIPERGLNEFSWGILEGKVPDEHQERTFKGLLEHWKEGRLDKRIEDGENPLEAWERASSFFEQILSLGSESKVLLCSHGRQLRVILSSLIDNGMHHMHKYPQHNTGLTVVRLEAPGQAALLVNGDISHLSRIQLPQ
ncbi:MAG: histidine phosphatase family protein [Bacteroidia bacterium]|nr:histidine phosphatase family protein [Bacteroidia bacterium]